jgi:uncharacterized membrane-anchored protein
VPGQKSEIVLSLLPLIESGQVGLEIDALAADAISACARFNIWFLKLKNDATVDDDALLELLERYEAATLECRSAVQKYREDGSRAELTVALRRVAEQLNRRPC